MPFRRKGKDAKIELLRGVSLFSACSKRDLSRVASLVDQIDVPQGKVLAKHGDPGSEFFVIAEGKAKVTVPGRRASSLGPGDSFGEMSLLDQGPRSATVTAETDMHLLVVNSRSFSLLIYDVPYIATKIMRVMAERLRAAERQPVH